MNKNGRILIVDDEAQNLAVLLEILKNDYSVIPAKAGEKALEIAVKNPQPDLIILDMVMPEMNGLEVARRLKSDPKTGSIPILFVSGNDDEKSIQKTEKAGAAGFLKKPVNPDQLMKKVKEVIAV
jgi:putative two-component system response regulator